MDNNNFYQDSESDRMGRFRKLSSVIAEFETQLNLPLDLLQWAKDAESEYSLTYNEVLNAKSDARHNKSELEELVNSLRTTYQHSKNILKARFINDNKYSIFGIEGRTPMDFQNLKNSAEIMLKAVQDLESQGITDILPANLITNLGNLLIAAADKNYQTGKIEEKLLAAKENLSQRTKSDNQKLRILYNIIVSVWGKEGFDLPRLGFAIDNKKRGRKRKSGKDETESNPVLPPTDVGS